MPRPQNCSKPRCERSATRTHPISLEDSMAYPSDDTAERVRSDSSRSRQPSIFRSTLRHFLPAYSGAMKSKLFVLVVVLLGCGTLGCISGSKTTCITSGTPIAVSRTNGSGDCSAAVVAGVAALNGVETYTPMKDLSCGITHFTLTVNFGEAGGTCQSSDAIMFQDLGSDGGTGP